MNSSIELLFMSHILPNLILSKLYITSSQSNQSPLFFPEIQIQHSPPKPWLKVSFLSEMPSFVNQPSLSIRFFQRLCSPQVSSSCLVSTCILYSILNYFLFFVCFLVSSQVPYHILHSPG